MISKDDLKNGKIKLPEEITEKIQSLVNMKANQENNKLCQVFCKIPNFNADEFCSKAAIVFDMILTAFACQDEKTLKMLLWRFSFR